MASPEENKEVVRSFIEYMLNRSPKDPEGAARTYLGSTYSQHSIGAPDGVDGFVKFFTETFERTPGMWTEIKDLVAENDKVAVFHHVRSSPEDKLGMLVFDLFRLDSGRIVEHWDVIMPIPGDVPASPPASD